MATKGAGGGSGTTKSGKTTGKLSRRAMISVLGTGLVASGLGRSRAVAMPEVAAAPKDDDVVMSFDGPYTVKCGDSFTVRPKPKNGDTGKQFFVKVTCKGDKIEVNCSYDPFK